MGTASGVLGCAGGAAGPVLRLRLLLLLVLLLLVLRLLRMDSSRRLVCMGGRPQSERLCHLLLVLVLVLRATLCCC